MIAALPMYDPPALRRANDRFWNLAREALGYGPASLARELDPWEAWLSPDLLLSQTCGMPFRKRLRGIVSLVATPILDLGPAGFPDLAPGEYFSVIVARRRAEPANRPPPTKPSIQNPTAGHAKDRAASGVSGRGRLPLPDGLAEFEGRRARLAVNDRMSQSGWAAPVLRLRNIGLAHEALPSTGSHEASARAVAEGRADLAGIDVATWAILLDTEPKLAASLRVADTTAPTPALPYITAAGRDPVPVRRALEFAADRLCQADRSALKLGGVTFVPEERYLEVPDPE